MSARTPYNHPDRRSAGSTQRDTERPFPQSRSKPVGAGDNSKDVISNIDSVQVCPESQLHQPDLVMEDPTGHSLDLLAVPHIYGLPTARSSAVVRRRQDGESAHSSSPHPSNPSHVSAAVRLDKKLKSQLRLLEGETVRRRDAENDRTALTISAMDIPQLADLPHPSRLRSRKMKAGASQEKSQHRGSVDIHAHLRELKRKISSSAVRAWHPERHTNTSEQLREGEELTEEGRLIEGGQLIDCKQMANLPARRELPSEQRYPVLHSIARRLRVQQQPSAMTEGETVSLLQPAAWQQQTGQDWLQTPQTGQDWLQTPKTGQDWLQTQQTGQDWLQTPQTGQDWLQTPQTGHVVACLQTQQTEPAWTQQTEKAWPETQLTEPAWLKTQQTMYADSLLETGPVWLQTQQTGHVDTWLQTQQTGHVDTWLQTKQTGNLDTLLQTQERGPAWLQTGPREADEPPVFHATYTSPAHHCNTALHYKPSRHPLDRSIPLQCFVEENYQSPWDALAATKESNHRKVLMSRQDNCRNHMYHTVPTNDERQYETESTHNKMHLKNQIYEADTTKDDTYLKRLQYEIDTGANTNHLKQLFGARKTSTRQDKENFPPRYFNDLYEWQGYSIVHGSFGRVPSDDQPVLQSTISSEVQNARVQDVSLPEQAAVPHHFSLDDATPATITQSINEWSDTDEELESTLTASFLTNNDNLDDSQVERQGSPRPVFTSTPMTHPQHEQSHLRTDHQSDIGQSQLDSYFTPAKTIAATRQQTLCPLETYRSIFHKDKHPPFLTRITPNSVEGLKQVKTGVTNADKVPSEALSASSHGVASNGYQLKQTQSSSTRYLSHKDRLISNNHRILNKMDMTLNRADTTSIRADTTLTSADTILNRADKTLKELDTPLIRLDMTLNRANTTSRTAEGAGTVDMASQTDSDLPIDLTQSGSRR